MTGSALAVCGLVGAGLSAALALVYIRQWRRAREPGRTPAGFGVFLAPAMLAGALLGGASDQLAAALAVATVVSAIYWLDDAVELSARLRVILSAVAGGAVALVFLIAAGASVLLFVVLVPLAMFVNVALVNTINFQDGADLNIAVFVLLTGALLLSHAPGDSEWIPVAVALLAFTLPFAVLNSRPRTIYFGDSGAFAFAMLFTVMGIAFIAGPSAPPPEAAIPAALPVIDMAVVTAHRIRIRQAFTVRHYFHLYQRLQKDQPGFVYLAPQLVTAALCLTVAWLLQKLAVDRAVAVALAMMLTSVPVFLAFRLRLVTSEPGPPESHASGVMSGRWERFCVVGVGGHARNRLIPAIRANDQILVGVVSRKQHDELPDVPVFASIEQALLALPKDTVFVLATPPAAHFEQALAILSARRDVFVEKPAFVTAAEARDAAAAASRSGALLVEGFMNRHTLTHRRYLADWAASPPVAVECVFTIPEAPAGTFRSDSALGSSNLYDIGAYFLAALLDAGLPLDTLTLAHVDEPGRPDRERLHFVGELGGVRVRGLIGVDAGYANSMTLTRSDGTALRYEPFVYGRPGARRVIATIEGGEHETVVEDVNAFEAIFAVPRGQWRSSQSDRLDRMVELTRQLERLGRALAQFRADRP